MWCFVMSVFDDPYTLAATASLVIQIVVLGLLLFAYSLKRQNKFRQHGIVMSAALILHLITVFAIMIPSFVLAIIPEFIVPTPLVLTSLIGLFHGATGILAAVLGVWLVAAWHFQSDLKPCFRKKQVMRITIVVWLISLLLGFALYAIFYVPMLIG